jgi:heme b synthase
MMMEPVPRLVYWELTKACNLNCIHCRAEAEWGPFEGELSLEEIRRVLDEIATRYSPIIVLTGGEPLVRHDIFQIADHARDAGLSTALATNGTLIDAEIAGRIRDAGIQRVSVSIDGADTATHDGFRGIPGSFERALEGIARLNAVGVDFQINTTITRRNEHQIEDIMSLAETLRAKALHIFMLVPVGCGVEIAETEMISPERYEILLNWFYDRSRDTVLELKATCAPHYYRIMRQRAREEGRKLTFETDGMAAVTRGCLAGTGVCFISHRGEVRPCGYLPMEAGNVRQSSFVEIWERSPLFLELRDLGNLKGKCGACEYRTVCAGCRARAYHQTGDYLSDEPFCTHVPAGLKK